jgi:gas vesicle protein
MLFKLNVWAFILFAVLIFSGCVTRKMSPSEKRSHQASRTIKKSQHKESRIRKKEAEKAKKRHWKNQSKEYKQTIRRNNKRLKREKSKKGREANDFIGD